MNIDARMSDFVEIEDALPLLSQQIGVKVARATASAWIANGYLPGVRLSGGKTVLVPKTAIGLFKKPGAGRYAKRQNLAYGIGIALKCLGEVKVPDLAVTNAKCPRCGNPCAIRGGIDVEGHEDDCCCCNLDCLYIGPDFLALATVDERATRGPSGLVTFRV